MPGPDPLHPQVGDAVRGGGQRLEMGVAGIAQEVPNRVVGERVGIGQKTTAELALQVD